jgi:adenosylcobinamide-GDP ribazoletransferase
MVLAPLVGLVLGLVALAVVGLVGLVTVGGLRGTAALVLAVLFVVVLALLTRGLHLDGLADTADGLGSRRPAAEALEVMRKGDVGPFGVVALVLTLLLQVASLARLLSTENGVTVIVLAAGLSRLVLALLCSRGVPSARPDGLGAQVAGSVSLLGALLSVVLTTVGFAVALPVARWLPGPASSTLHVPTAHVAAWVAIVLLPLLVAGLLALQCRRRLGGVTGDVLGACVEVAFTTTLVVGALTVAV